MLWLVFWTCAYIFHPQASENVPAPPPALTVPTAVAVIATTILGLPWIVSGFRSS
jgi:hypothetical protein